MILHAKQFMFFYSYNSIYSLILLPNRKILIEKSRTLYFYGSGVRVIKSQTLFPSIFLCLFFILSLISFKNIKLFHFKLKYLKYICFKSFFRSFTSSCRSFASFTSLFFFTKRKEKY